MAETYYYNNNPARLPHFQTDALTVRHIYTYIRSQRLGSPFRLTVVIGHYPRSCPALSDAAFNLLTRPIVHFTCWDDENGNVVIGSDALRHDYMGWAGKYFDEARLKVTPGITYPNNLAELMAAEQEANQMMQSFCDVESQEEADSLFGDS